MLVSTVTLCNIGLHRVGVCFYRASLVSIHTRLFARPSLSTCSDCSDGGGDVALCFVWFLYVYLFFTTVSQ